MKRASDGPVSVVRWEEPPQQIRLAHGCVSDEALATLRLNPGKWALLRTGAKAFGSPQAKKARELHPDFEFVGRRIDAETGGLYGRFVGEAEAEGDDDQDDEIEDDDEPEDGETRQEMRKRIADQVDREREKRRKAGAAAL